MIEVIESGWVTQVSLAQSGLGQIGTSSLGIEHAGSAHVGFFSIGLDLFLTLLTASYLSFLLLQEGLRRFTRREGSWEAGYFENWRRQFNDLLAAPYLRGWDLRERASLREKRSLRHQRVSLS